MIEAAYAIDHVVRGDAKGLVYGQNTGKLRHGRILLSISVRE
jgi:hypothetical protein